MVRWRLCLALAVLLLLPTIIGSKSNDDEDDEDSENKEDFKQSKVQLSKYQTSRRNDDSEDEDDDDDEDDEEETGKDAPSRDMGNNSPDPLGTAEPQSRNVPMGIVTPKGLAVAITRTSKKRPLECYVCAFKSETPLRACLDPTKFRVHTITCHSIDDRCFTSVISKGDVYEAVVRGCRSGCVGSAETTCCELNRCNNQAFAMPLMQPRSVHISEQTSSKAYKCFPPTIVFFITILLLLQTVGRVALV